MKYVELSWKNIGMGTIRRLSNNKKNKHWKGYTFFYNTAEANQLAAGMPFGTFYLLIKNINTYTMAQTKTASTKKASQSGKLKSSGANNSQLEKFFIDGLKDLYWAEKHLTKALPKMQKAATTEELKTAIDEHLAQTEEHVTRLEEVFSMMDRKPQAKKCDAMEGLIKEGESIVEETEDGSMTRDVGIIMAAQKIEHYEIASYGGLAQLARTMERDDIAEILATTLEEEKQTDENLTTIAESNINWAAEQEDEETEE